MSKDEDFRDGDETLIRRTATGHRSAFNTLVERHHAAVYRFARSLAHDDEAASDAVAATFLQAWRNAGRFRGEAAVRPRLLALTRQHLERRQGQSAEGPGELQPLGDIGQAAGWGSTRDHLADRFGDRDLLRRSLAALPSADRALLILRDLEGLPTSEAAEVMGFPEAALKIRLHRARLRLLARLRQEAGDGG